MPQRPHLFHGTVADNIRMARPDAPMERVRAAAADAGLLSFIESLPHQWDTEIGERGARFSGGQAQRLALARAFLKDAPVVVLDEPTSYLDAESEEQLRQAVERLSAGRTTLVIAHRLATVRQASRIVVLEGGRVVEQGAPAELAAAGGAFAAMLRAARGEAP